MYIEKKYRIYSLFVISVVFACFIINLFIKNGMDFNYMLLDVIDINYIFQQEVTSSVLYIVLKRLKHIILIFLFIKAFRIEKVYSGLIVLAGAVFGMMMSIQIYYLGIVGVITFMLYIFPHYLIYFYSIAFIYKNKSSGGKGEEVIKKYIAVAFIFLIGILCESIFSRFFLIKFYQYMVM